jgi:hypothetical protein
MGMEEESKNEQMNDGFTGRRVFGVVVRGFPADLEAWIDSAKHHGIYVIFSKSSRTGKLIIKEEIW